MVLVPSNPGWFTGYIPSAEEWAAEWSAKVDFPAPIWQGGTGSQTAYGANYNIQQRALIDDTLATPLQLLTEYGVKADSGPATLLLPPIAQTIAGDWVSLTDIDGSAGTNIVTIQANGAELIDLYGTSATTQQIAVDWGSAVLVSTGFGWRMVSGSALAPHITGAITGTEAWNVNIAGAIQSITANDIASFVGSVSQFLQWAIWFNQTPEVSELLALYTTASILSFPSGLTTSQGSPPKVNPTASFVMDINHIVSGVSSIVGTITVATDGTVTLASAGFVTAIGDQLSVTAPAVADATIMGFSATLKAVIL